MAHISAVSIRWRAGRERGRGPSYDVCMSAKTLLANEASRAFATGLHLPVRQGDIIPQLLACQFQAIRLDARDLKRVAADHRLTSGLNNRLESPREA